MPITYAIVGTNWITDTWITAAQKTGSFQLHAVYSRTRETAEKFGSRYGCTKYYTSLDELAADKDLQLVYIASPNNLHYEQAKQMIEAGKHILLEKPATSTVAELEDLFRLAKHKGVILIEAYRHIQEANFKRLEKFLEEKKLGEIYGASVTYASYSSRYNNVLAGERPNIFTLDFSGGSLVDVGVYPVTFAVTLFGQPISQTYAPFVCRTGVDGGGMIILKYKDFGVQINNSKVYKSTAPTEIYGEKGTLVVDTTAGISSIVFHGSDKTEQELATSKTENFMEEEAKEFARIIEQHDKAAIARLEEISKSVIKVTTALRYENGLYYPADKK
ncbi:hypothetical protein AMS68_005135 [Peltaster fructicola]|uniref:Uncharacterized protein n=1 Tax=Peltaster fructicola TaxID=286661 RepID=A0A6H0XYF0_9PEZI|nr:hypothetical protein AMS68_005135 [Peltaster fructicola]